MSALKDTDYLENGWATEFQTDVLARLLESFILIILMSKGMERIAMILKFALHRRVRAFSLSLEMLALTG